MWLTLLAQLSDTADFTVEKFTTARILQTDKTILQNCC